MELSRGLATTPSLDRLSVASYQERWLTLCSLGLILYSCFRGEHTVSVCSYSASLSRAGHPGSMAGPCTVAHACNQKQHLDGWSKGISKESQSG